MFKTLPKILAHRSSIVEKNLITPEYILNDRVDYVNLYHRYCPHRMYPLGSPGDLVENIVCKFHGFEWNKDGIPLNNDRKIACGKATIGRSGLIFKDFQEPNHQWVDDLAKEKNLKYSHTLTGASKGNWLWMMEIQADLLHIRKGENVVHPNLSEVTDLSTVTMEDGDGWILQTCSTGWWLFIYPFTFIEWSPGCLSVNYTVPENVNKEFGFSWNTQFYYDPSISESKRKEFETLEDVFKEDVATIEMQRGLYFPITKPYNRLEDHCVHFGKWVKENRVHQ